MPLSAAQLIYTNVEKKLSSKGRDGYQVWLRTPGLLSEAEETEIQNRLGDFEDRREPAADKPPARHVFFPLPSGRAVISRTVPLAETDKFNRSGRFYAHAFVIEPNDFAQIGNDPFAVVDQMEFQSSLDDGLKTGNPVKGTIPAARFENRSAARVKGTLSPDQIQNLLPALLHACSPHDKRLMIGVPGAPVQVLQLLRQLFDWLPPSLRRICSFDTLSNGRNLTQVPFAVAGLPLTGPPRRYINLLLLDPARQALSQAVPPVGGATFEQWLLQQVKRSADAPAASRAEAAFRLSACLDSGSVPSGDLSIVDAPMFEQLACSEAGVPKLERVLRARLSADAGPVLEPLIFAFAWNWLSAGGLDGLRSLSQPLSQALVLRWLLAVYEQRGGDEIDRSSEPAALKEILEQSKAIDGEAVALRKRLILIWYRWAGRWSNLARSARDVKMVPDEIYQWFVEWAMRAMPVRISMGAGSNRGSAWCGPEVSASDPRDAEECGKLFSAILGIDSHQGDEFGEANDGTATLPPERWEWIMFHLLTQVRRNGRA